MNNKRMSEWNTGMNECSKRVKEIKEGISVWMNKEKNIQMSDIKQWMSE